MSGQILRLSCRPGAAQDTDWEVQTDIADFRPSPCSPPSLEHMANNGYRRYVEILSDIFQPVWWEIEQAIRDFAPDAARLHARVSEIMREADYLNRVRREWRERPQRTRRSLADEGAPPTLKRAARFAAKRADFA